MIAREIYIKTREAHRVETSNGYEVVLAYSSRNKMFGLHPMVGYVLKDEYDELEKKYRELLKKTGHEQ